MHSTQRDRRFIRRLPTGHPTGLVPVSNPSLSETWTYSYDAVSNITGITKPGGAESYGYDTLDRLDSYTLPGSSAVTYGYDAVGNRLSETEAGVTQNHTYGTSSNRHLTQAGSALTYDANGNRLTDQGGARTFTYNQRNRMTSVAGSYGRPQQRIESYLIWPHLRLTLNLHGYMSTTMSCFQARATVSRSGYT